MQRMRLFYRVLKGAKFFLPLSTRYFGIFDFAPPPTISMVVGRFATPYQIEFGGTIPPPRCTPLGACPHFLKILGGAATRKSEYWRGESKNRKLLGAAPNAPVKSFYGGCPPKIGNTLVKLSPSILAVGVFWARSAQYLAPKAPFKNLLNF